MSGEAHRAGAWKQSNKGHKTGRHRSKGAVEKENRGRVGAKVLAHKKGGQARVLARLARRHQAGQLRRQARDLVQESKRAVGGAGHPPLLVSVVPLAASQVEGAGGLVKMFTSCLPDLEVVQGGGLVHMVVPRFKQRFSVVQPKWDSLHQVLDTAKVADSVIFLLCPHTGMDGWGEKLLSSVLAQGLSADPVFVVGSLDEIPPKKHQEVKKLLLKALERKLPVEKVWSVQGEGDVVNLVRAVGGLKRKEVKQRDRRAHMLGERVGYNPDTGVLSVTGYLRGAPLSVDRLVHIPGLGDFQLDRVTSGVEPLRLGGRKKGEEEMVEDGGELARAGEERQELDVENEVDCMEGEQTWPTEEELMAAEEGGKKVVRVPRGTSEYQAAWIAEEGEEEDTDESDNEDGDEAGSDDGMDGLDAASESEQEFEQEHEGEGDDTDTMTTDGETFGDYDHKHVNFAEEVEQMEALKSARLDSMFPDEVDTPMDSQARVRFQKYRGLKSFRTSVWDYKENLPVDYARIWQFENFDRTRRRVLAEEVTGVSVGSYVTLHIAGVGAHLVPHLGRLQAGLVVTSLLPHEHRMSVVNMVVRRSPLASEEPVKAKSRLLFQVGWRRFAACPLFSQHTNGNKHKYERFFREGVVVMTTFAPICFPPAPVLVFQEGLDGRQSLLATGTLLSSDPNRVIVKRTVLSGHPFKVHKRVCTVRFMFFNREDVEWFKPIELRTKQGRRGHIKEGLGTHGHMKCIFDGQVSQQDMVMMNLYKRMFPKWTYDPHVPDCQLSAVAVGDKQEEEATVMDI